LIIQEDVQVVTEPATEPISVADQKVWSSIDHNEHDLLLQGLIQAARIACEKFTGLSLTARTLKLIRPSFPCGWDYELRLPRTPLGNTVATPIVVTYLDSERAEQTLDAGDYYAVVGAVRASLYPRTSWPTPACWPDAVRVTYPAGFTGPIPDPLLAGMRMHVAAMYENREGQAETDEELPRVVARLYRPLSRYTL
jgi:uncharacterized phiE125 gp8 family phage protein